MAKDYEVCDGDAPYKLEFADAIPCHCGPNRESTYQHIECEMIESKPFERILVIFLFLYDVSVILLCSYWLITFWHAQNKQHTERRGSHYIYYLKVRSPLYLLLSYSMILIFILEEGVATIWLYWSDHDTPPRDLQWDGVNYWTNYDGTPIYFGRIADLLLHFLFWAGFWAFFQLKIFKFWMMRYHYEYYKLMSNLKWREHLGLNTVEPKSFFLRYRSILGNPFLMCFFQVVVLVMVLFIQIFIRLLPMMTTEPMAPLIEHVVIMVIALSEFFFVIWLMHHIQVVNDNFFLRPESMRIFISCVIGGAAWILGLIVAESAAASFIWVRCGTILLYSTWICSFCYLETIWVLKRIDAEDSTRQIEKDHSNFGSLGLGEILRSQEGFEALMRFLVKEWSC